HLALTRGALKCAAARVHLGVLAVQVERRVLALALGALEVELGGLKILGAHRRAGGGALKPAGLLHVLGGSLQHRLTAETQRERRGELLLGELFLALPERAHALELEREGTVHGPSDRLALRLLNLSWTPVRRRRDSRRSPRAGSPTRHPPATAGPWRKAVRSRAHRGVPRAPCRGPRWLPRQARRPARAEASRGRARPTGERSRQEDGRPDRPRDR